MMSIFRTLTTQETTVIYCDKNCWILSFVGIMSTIIFQTNSLCRSCKADCQRPFHNFLVVSSIETNLLLLFNLYELRTEKAPNLEGAQTKVSCSCWEIGILRMCLQILSGKLFMITLGFQSFFSAFIKSHTKKILFVAWTFGGIVKLGKLGSPCLRRWGLLSFVQSGYKFHFAESHSSF